MEYANNINNSTTYCPPHLSLRGTNISLVTRRYLPPPHLDVSTAGHPCTLPTIPTADNHNDNNTYDNISNNNNNNRDETNDHAFVTSTHYVTTVDAPHQIRLNTSGNNNYYNYNIFIIII